MLRQLSYLLPTREAIMEGRPETAPSGSSPNKPRPWASPPSGSATP